MSKVIIHYFTGTGNTAHSVKFMSEQLQAAGHEVKVRQVKKKVLSSDEVFDYQIIAFPVLSWTAPVIMKRYVRQMPRSKGTKTAILAKQGSH
jgi:flavodoxin